MKLRACRIECATWRLMCVSVTLKLSGREQSLRVMWTGMSKENNEEKTLNYVSGHGRISVSICLLD